MHAYPTPPHVYAEINRTRPPCERYALLRDHECLGRSTREHVWTYAGRQINEVWAIIQICEWAHSVGAYAMNGGLNKEINRWISLRHATAADLKKYPRIDWQQQIKYLNGKYQPVTL